MHGVVISGLDLSWTGEAPGGWGISVGPGSTANRIDGVAVEQREYAIEIHGDTQIQIAGVDFSDSYYGLRLFDVGEDAISTVRRVLDSGASRIPSSCTTPITPWFLGSTFPDWRGDRAR